MYRGRYVSICLFITGSPDLPVDGHRAPKMKYLVGVAAPLFSRYVCFTICLFISPDLDFVHDMFVSRYVCSLVRT